MVAGPLASFALVFAVIGATELLDRTNFALIGLAARRHPLEVWGGAALAFLLTTTLAVAIGAALLAALGGQVVYLRLGGGVLLIAYAAYLVLVPAAERATPAGRSAFSTAFLMILLLELGDTTMIFTINFVTTIAPLVVGVAAAAALVTVAGSACFIGPRLGTRLAPRHLDRLVVVLLTVVGAATILYALDPGLFPAFLR